MLLARASSPFLTPSAGQPGTINFDWFGRGLTSTCMPPLGDRTSCVCMLDAVSMTARRRVSVICVSSAISSAATSIRLPLWQGAHLREVVAHRVGAWVLGVVQRVTAGAEGVDAHRFNP